MEEPRVGDVDRLKIEHLTEDDSSRAYLLRKPDFQRATSAWSPSECVELLESFLLGQVVPSVILWLSPESHWYVLDGGHRISVVIAWIRDSWGNRRDPSEYKDDRLYDRSVQAAKEVRKLLERAGIRPYREYRDADRRWRTIQAAGRNPDNEMSETELLYAKLVRDWKSTKIGFPILWVEGTYEVAERSFLKINKSGRQLSPWETTLVEYRQSSFARAVMSIARVGTKEYCWPIDDPQIRSDRESQRYVAEILDAVQELHNLLFLPTYETPINRPDQPILATPYTRPELQPAYLSELLTITEGHRGQKPETKRLLERDARQSVPIMLATGHKMLRNARNVLHNIAGNTPTSMSLAPLVYFYNNAGTYVRSLLYGMIYWLNSGSEEDITTRKLAFTIYRGAFEQVLLTQKDRIIQRITRRIGSGPEVTYPTALYFDGLLRLLITHGGVVTSEPFQDEHEGLIETLSLDKDTTPPGETVSPSRNYRGTIRNSIHIDGFLKMLPTCEICGGRYYPRSGTQIDHRQPHSQGGPTSPSNGRETHPFCNHRRATIEAIQRREIQITLPSFDDPRQRPKAEQHSFLPFLDAMAEESSDVLDDGANEDEDEVASNTDEID